MLNESKLDKFFDVLPSKCSDFELEIYKYGSLKGKKRDSGEKEPGAT